MEEERNDEIIETFGTSETDVIEVDHSSEKAVVIGAVVATAVTAGLYGLSKLGGKVVAKVKRAKLKKQAEDEIAQARAFESYDEKVAEIHRDDDDFIVEDN